MHRVCKKCTHRDGCPFERLAPTQKQNLCDKFSTGRIAEEYSNKLLAVMRAGPLPRGSREYDAEKIALLAINGDELERLNMN